MSCSGEVCWGCWRSAGYWECLFDGEDSYEAGLAWGSSLIGHGRSLAVGLAD